jgi:hypothetical protein
MFPLGCWLNLPQPLSAISSVHKCPLPADIAVLELTFQVDCIIWHAQQQRRCSNAKAAAILLQWAIIAATEVQTPSKVSGTSHS